jgi:hypothetical protein
MFVVCSSYIFDIVMIDNEFKYMFAKRLAQYLSGLSGTHYVSMVLRYCLPADAFYVSGSVVDRGSDYHPIESFVVHSSNIGIVGPGCEGSNLALFLIFLSNVPCV